MDYYIKYCQIYTGEKVIEDGYLIFDTKIRQVGRMAEFIEPEGGIEIKHTDGQFIIPGFIDVHSHGGYGVDVMDGEPHDIVEMMSKMIKEGITSYFATTMTQSDEQIENALVAVKEAKEVMGSQSIIEGIHLEGPFVSLVFKGAQPEKFIVNPNVGKLKQWQEISGGLIKLVTYGAELEGASDFERFCTENQIVMSVGHSDATRAILKQSAATHITHLYNAQRGLHHREAGVTGHGLLEERMMCEVICDGFHISPDMVKLAFMIKGPDRLELITDSMRAKGMPEGESELGGQRVIINEKQARLVEGNLAGSVLTFIEAFQNIIKFTGCSIKDAVKMSSGNQAKEFKLANKGFLKVGFDADFLLMDESLNLQKTIVKGMVHSYVTT